MNFQLKKEINNTAQIKKFSAYGFLKNLKFFEPYLVIYLLGNGYSLFQIGLLYSVREIITYVFEVPSGIIADFFGRKRELYMCFTFYIVSFLLFFLGSSYWLIAIAMVFFGLGEAFRSGTHKAMIYTYLEEQGWSEHKAYVYGRTRSFSLIGSAVSALLAIVLILNIPSSRYIFLASIIPYILDLLLIMTYPKFLDFSHGHDNVTNKEQRVSAHLKDIYSRPELRRILLNSGAFEAIFKSVKDMIQPILELMIVSSGILLIDSMTSEENLKIILGISYGAIYLFSAYASRKAYRLKALAQSAQLLNVIYLALALTLMALFYAIRSNQVMWIVLLFLLLYILRDIRKPIFVDACDDYMEKHQRATVLSIESQLKAFFTIILAPVVGFFADKFGISIVMLTLASVLAITYLQIKVVEIK